MSKKIKKALARLDPSNDDHWTDDGAPRLGALGIDGLTRPEVTRAAPLFTRDNPTLEQPTEKLPAAAAEKLPELPDTPDQPEGNEFGGAAPKAPARLRQAQAQPTQEELKAICDECEAQLRKMKKTMHELEQQIAGAELRRLTAYRLMRRAQKFDRNQHTQLIQDHLKAVGKNTAEQIAKQASTQSPIERSKLDQAMSVRKSAHGSRPQFHQD